MRPRTPAPTTRCGVVRSGPAPPADGGASDDDACQEQAGRAGREGRRAERRAPADAKAPAATVTRRRRRRRQPSGRAAASGLVATDDGDGQRVAANDRGGRQGGCDATGDAPSSTSSARPRPWPRGPAGVFLSPGRRPRWRRPAQGAATARDVRRKRGDHAGGREGLGKAQREVGRTRPDGMGRSWRSTRVDIAVGVVVERHAAQVQADDPASPTVRAGPRALGARIRAGVSRDAEHRREANEVLRTSVRHRCHGRLPLRPWAQSHSRWNCGSRRCSSPPMGP